MQKLKLRAQPKYIKAKRTGNRGKSGMTISTRSRRLSRRRRGREEVDKGHSHIENQVPMPTKLKKGKAKAKVNQFPMKLKKDKAKAKVMLPRQNIDGHINKAREDGLPKPYEGH